MTIKFTPEQIKAINHNKGGLQLIACAGAGKTEVICQRITKLIKNGASPSEIVAFTFTEKAADEMKTRIRQILDRECPDRADFGEMYIGTIHSFCFSKLKDIEPEYKAYDVLDEAQRVAFVSKPKVFYSIGLGGFQISENGKKYKAINKFLHSVDIMRSEDIDPDNLTDENFAYAFKEYIKLLDENRYLDFGEMIFRFVKVLQKDKDALKRLHEQINHLVVDEYQDVNLIQEKLIELITAGCKSVCVVGDDDQCVYQWRGSDPKYIINFEKKYFTKHFEVQMIPLETNFRSTEAIIYTARDFIRKNTTRIPKEMKKKVKARPYEKGDIVYKHFETQDDEFEFICKTIKQIIGTRFIDKYGKPFSISELDIAVLVRTNEEARRLISHLENHNIEFILGGGQHIFERPEVILATECIAYIFGCNGFNGNITDKMLIKLYEDVFQKKKFPKADSKKFIKKIEDIKKAVNKIKEKGTKDYLPDGLQIFYHAILNAMGSEDFEFPPSFNYNLAMLSQAISDYEGVWRRLRALEVKYFFGFLQTYARGHYTESSHNDPALINAVKVMTIHKSKGLEFPVVFLPGFVSRRKGPKPQTYIDDDLYPVERYHGTIEDERRVYYTAFTRSEKYLFITSHRKRKGRKTDCKPHEFMTELNKKYITDKLPKFKKDKTLAPRAIGQAIYPTSFSELSIYNRCPQDFNFRHVFGYNAGVPVTFGYGTNIHNILNVIHKKYKKKPPSEKEIEKIFENMFYMRYATDAIAENMRKAGMRIVKNYVKKHGEAFKEILQTEKEFEFVLRNALISGQIDLIKKLDNHGNIKGIEIVDFKTEKNETYSLDYKTQLRLYAIACLKTLGLNPKKAFVHHLDNDKRDPVDISKKNLDETKKFVSKTVDHILKKKFPPKASKKNCIGCDYEKICPMKKYKWKYQFKR